jgi:hypothetical protein
VAAAAIFGYALTFAQLLGAVGSNQPYYVLFPVGQATTFRSGAMLGSVVPITDTLTGNPGIPKDAAAATFMIVAWDNSSGLYPTWTEAAVGWQKLSIAVGWSAPFTVTAIGGDTNSPPYLNNSQCGANGMTSFNLWYSLGYGTGPPTAATLAATDVTATSATLNGTVTANHLCGVTAAFQWGTNTYYGNVTPGTNFCYTADNWPLSASLTGLTPGTTYHFRALAAFEVGPFCGSDQTFTTPFTTPLAHALTINTGSGYWDAAS